VPALLYGVKGGAAVVPASLYGTKGGAAAVPASLYGAKCGDLVVVPALLNGVQGGTAVVPSSLNGTTADASATTAPRAAFPSPWAPPSVWRSGSPTHRANARVAAALPFHAEPPRTKTQGATLLRSVSRSRAGGRGGRRATPRPGPTAETADRQIPPPNDHVAWPAMLSPTLRRRGERPGHP